MWSKAEYGPPAAGLKVLAVSLFCAVAPATAQQAPDATVTIAALGDSLTAGYGLPQQEGLVPQLQAWLDERGENVRLLNAGVSGDTSAGGLSRVGWTLTPEVDALIVALGGNDLLRGIEPAETRANLEGILRAGQERGLALMLVGLTAPGNFGPDYKRAFDAIYGDLAAEYGAILVPDLLAPISGRPDRAAALRQFMQADGLHPNAAGVALIVEALGPPVGDLAAQARAARGG